MFELCRIGAIYKDENIKITKYYLNVNARSGKRMLHKIKSLERI